LAEPFRGKRFLEIDQSETKIACGAMFVNESGQMTIMYREPSIDAFYQISVHLGKRFQRRIFLLEINKSEIRMACGSHVC
jgi:hypothetical protein